MVMSTLTVEALKGEYIAFRMAFLAGHKCLRPNCSNSYGNSQILIPFLQNGNHFGGTKYLTLVCYKPCCSKRFSTCRVLYEVTQKG